MSGRPNKDVERVVAVASMATGTPPIVVKAVAAALAFFLMIVMVASMGATLASTAQGSCEPSEEVSGGGKVKGVPKKYVPMYVGSAKRFKLGNRGPAILAAIHRIETDFGRLGAPGVNDGENFAGAGGPMQFLGASWDAYGFDGDKDGDKDRYDAIDAIYAAGNLLSNEGAPEDWYGAVFTYNRADWYVQDIFKHAKQYGGFEDVEVEVTTCPKEQDGAIGTANLKKAVKLTEPRAYKTLPANLMASGRAPQQVDARIYDNAVWALKFYKMRVTAARESGHASHGGGLALDIVPADCCAQSAWDKSTLKFATDIGWRNSCGGSGVAPACPLVPAIRFVGYEGYPSHGSPKTCSGGCPAHLHVSWEGSDGAVGALSPPAAWVMAFISPKA